MPWRISMSSQGTGQPHDLLEQFETGWTRQSRLAGDNQDKVVPARTITDGRTPTILGYRQLEIATPAQRDLIGGRSRQLRMHH